MQMLMIGSRFERIEDLLHRATQASQRVGKKLEALVDVAVLGELVQLFDGQIGFLEDALGAHQKRFDSADRQRALAQIVGEKQREVFELPLGADDAAGTGLSGEDEIAGAPPRSSSF